MSNANTLSRTESRQIEIARIVCIFFMVSAHIYPDTRTSSLLYGGDLHFVWLVWVDFFARASVAVLSVCAGYIVWIQRRRVSTKELIVKKFSSLYAPMVIMQVVFFAMVFAFVFLKGGKIDDVFTRLEVDGWPEIVNAIFGVFDSHLNMVLVFLRDLFVSLIIIHAAASIIQRHGIALLAVLVPLSIFGSFEPIVLRPNILVFALAGAVLADKGISLHSLSQSRPALAFSSLFLALFFGTHLLDLAPSAELDHWLNFTKRCCLVLFVLWLCRIAAERLDVAPGPGSRDVLFSTFLTHGLVGQILATAWRALGLDPHAYYYLGFFALNIVAFFLVGYAVSRLRTEVLGAWRSARAAA